MPGLGAWRLHRCKCGTRVESESSPQDEFGIGAVWGSEGMIYSAVAIGDSYLVDKGAREITENEKAFTPEKLVKATCLKEVVLVVVLGRNEATHAGANNRD